MKNTPLERTSVTDCKTHNGRTSVSDGCDGSELSQNLVLLTDRTYDWHDQRRARFRSDSGEGSGHLYSQVREKRTPKGVDGQADVRVAQWCNYRTESGNASCVDSVFGCESYTGFRMKKGSFDRSSMTYPMIDIFRSK